jgi:hypothetical protein
MREVPCGTCYDDNKLRACNEECSNPKNSKAHENHHVSHILIPLDLLVLRSRGAVINLSYREDANSTEDPARENNDVNDEENDRHSDYSQVAAYEVRSSF